MRRPPEGGTPNQNRPPRQGFWIVALVASASLATLAVFANTWSQRSWLGQKWLGDELGLRLGALALAALACFAALARVAIAWRRGHHGLSTRTAVLRAFVAAVAGWAFVWRRDPTVPRQDLLVAASVAVGIWCAWVAIDSRARGGNRSRWRRMLELLLLEIAAAVVAAEVSLRLIRLATDHPLLETPGEDVDAWIREHSQRPGSYRLGFPIDSNGFVDQELGRESRPPHLVVCLGDSFSVAVVPHHRHYTTVAERELDGVEVYNAGVVNSGPREYLRMLEVFAVPPHPELIVVALFLGNDVEDAHRRDATLLVSWIDLQELLVVQVPSRAWAIWQERRAGTLAVAGMDAGAAFGVPGTVALSPEEIERRLPWLDDPLTEPAAVSRDRFLYVERKRAADLLRMKESDYADLYSHLERMRIAAGSIPLAVLLFPDEFQVEDALWEQVHPEQGERDSPQRMVGEWLEQNGVPYVDLLPRLRAMTPLSDGRLHVYHLQDTHFNSRGNELAGRALSELIERCGVAKRR